MSKMVSRLNQYIDYRFFCALEIRLVIETEPKDKAFESRRVEIARAHSLFGLGQYSPARPFANEPVGEVEMLKEKKEEGAEPEAVPAEKGEKGEKAEKGDKAAPKGAEKTPPKAADKAPAPAAEKPGEKKPERVAGKKPERKK